jgi:hypothetical protein
VLSTSRTGQPQRWALVPAVVRAAAGVAVLALSPTGNELGWVWPPAMLALAVWMIVRSRRDLASRARVLVLYPVCTALALSAGVVCADSVRVRWTPDLEGRVLLARP